ncbi:hypothetical protein ACHAPT_009758 [Fusarium lateritium]
MPESWWDDFSNNLATDLAPLVALFGEQPTKQYLSECLTIEDVIIFAAAPMGVITAVVSAIRVCGTPSLRAFVGRAQEGAGVAEAELCSSTSRDVCELYSNGGIARVFGRPKVLEVVHDPRASDEDFFSFREERAAGIYPFPEYVRTERGGKEWDLQQSSSESREDLYLSASSEEGVTTQKPARFAPNPNLSLNIGIKPKAHGWFVASAAVGAVMQLFVLVWAGLARYYYKWVRDGQEDKYAFPLTVIGTILLSLGMGLCAHLIASKTEERVYQRAESSDATSKPRMYWIQPGNQNLGDQTFDAFGFSDAKSPLQKYITSWKITTRDSSANRAVWVAVAATSLGFMCQFIGLRAGHSSVAVMQLGVTLAMSGVRAGLRTQRLSQDDNFMADDPDSFLGHELDVLALMLGSPPAPGDSDSTTQFRPRWRIFTDPETRPVAVPPRRYNGVKPFLLKLPSVEPGHLPKLTGFHIPVEANFDIIDAESQIAHWLSAIYRIEDDSLPLDDDDCKRKDISAAVKTFLYRARLARLTALHGSGSERHNNWGAKFVPVRDIAMILTQAIEDTMVILWDAQCKEPVQLRESWERAFVTLWSVDCCMRVPGGVSHKDTLHMTLRRSTGPWGNPYGPWKADSSEIEAVLGLLLWSSREPGKKRDGEDLDVMTAEAIIERIVSVIPKNPDDAFDENMQLNLWRVGGTVRELRYPLGISSETNLVNKQHATWCFDGAKYVTNDTRPPDYPEQPGQFLGWSSMKTVWWNGDLSVRMIHAGRSLAFNYAQELYSTFLTAITQAVKDLGGRSEAKRDGYVLTASNETVNKIQSALVMRGLCGLEDVAGCTIPPLRSQGLLKPPDETVVLAGELAEEYRQMEEWDRYVNLANWQLQLQYAKVVSTHSHEKDAAGAMEATNELRLLLIDNCQSFIQLLQQEDVYATYTGCIGILSLLDRYREDETINSIPLVWTDHRTAPDRSPEKGPQNLAETVECYGQAARYQLERNQQLTDQEKEFMERSKTYCPAGREAADLIQAILDRDLGSTVSILAKSPSQESQKTHALQLAVRNGWYMIVKELVLSGADVYEKDEAGRIPLLNAVRSGDINTVRVLIQGVDLRDEIKRTAYREALDRGYGVMVQDMEKNWQGSSFLST